MKLRDFKQWITRTFMPELHDEYLRLLREVDGLNALLQSSRSHGIEDRATTHRLRLERADLTEIVLSLVAKDEAGLWTTVFDEDTHLPVEFNVLLNELVNRS